MEDGDKTEKILFLIRGLAAGASKGHIASQSFARLSTTLENCHSVENMKLVAQLLLRSILEVSHRTSEIEQRALRRDLGCIVGRMGAYLVPISLLLFRRFANLGDEEWDYMGDDALLGGPPSPILAVKQFSIGAFEQRNGVCMNELGIMYEHGFRNNLAQPKRAERIYRRAIDECRDFCAMNNLGYVLRHGADGVPVDPVAALNLYRRAVEEGGDALAMGNLGSLLEYGAEGVQADPVKAVDMYSRAFHEGSLASPMSKQPGDPLGKRCEGCTG